MKNMTILRKMRWRVEGDDVEDGGVKEEDRSQDPFPQFVQVRS